MIADLRFVTMQVLELPLRNYRMENEPFVSMNIRFPLDKDIILKPHHNVFVNKHAQVYKKLASCPDTLEVSFPTFIPLDWYKFKDISLVKEK